MNESLTNFNSGEYLQGDIKMMLTKKVIQELLKALACSTNVKNENGHSPFLGRFSSAQDLVSIAKFGKIDGNNNLVAVINGKKIILTVDNNCLPCNMNLNNLVIFKVNLKDDSLVLEISHLGNSIEIELDLFSKMVTIQGDQFKDQRLWDGIPYDEREWEYSFAPVKRPVVRK
jgi:hypothetical protein